MSQQRALEQIERFLANADPEVLSISGRWGVGKTYLWDETLKAHRANTPVRRYAYVSVFGLRSLDALKTAIVQSTVPLDGKELEPTVESFLEHVSSFSGLKRLGEQTARQGMKIFSKGASTLPYVGKLADLLAPGASLLIRDQIICIDDIERAGQGLDVADVLGLVSLFRERRRCKVVLLLNEDGLGDQGVKYRAFLEKVVDQAVKFEPTADESAGAAIQASDVLGQKLARRTVKLGIRNIRVVRRIRRFLRQIEPELIGLNDRVTDQVVRSIALIGWCVFEPSLAPDLEGVRRYAQFRGMFSKEKRSKDELKVEQLLRAYDFGSFDSLDELILEGLLAGAFDRPALRVELKSIDDKVAKQEVREVIAKPMSIFHDGIGNDTAEFLDALVVAMEQYGEAMDPRDASDALRILRELGRPDEADRLLPIYVTAQQDKPRGFFAAYSQPDGQLDPQIADAFNGKLAQMPLVRNSAEILLKIASSRSWNPEDIAYLASVPPEGFDEMLTTLKGDDFHAVVSMALDFGHFEPRRANEAELASRMAAALVRASASSGLNRLRLMPYLAIFADKNHAIPPEDGSDLSSI